MTRPSKISTNSIRFRLALSGEKYLAYYAGRASFIDVYSEDNRRIRFPANAIRHFLTHDGVFGTFDIHFDENNKLVEVSRVGSFI